MLSPPTALTPTRLCGEEDKDRACSFPSVPLRTRPGLRELEQPRRPPEGPRPGPVPHSRAVSSWHQRFGVDTIVSASEVWEEIFRAQIDEDLRSQSADAEHGGQIDARDLQDHVYRIQYSQFAAENTSLASGPVDVVHGEWV